ncbi:MAG: MFS transporter [Deltaproteobacteria bacterium]|nr:MFS transporter [Deltaproteobacteria bacterium]
MIKRNIVVMAFVSFLNDIASEATLRLLPLFLSQVLGTGSGLSDRLPRRKPLVVAGYSVSAFTRPLLLVAGTWPLVFLVRFTDRLGKGVRAAPRDALIADEAQADKRGHSFGLNRALDTAGAIVGLLIAYTVLAHSDTLTRASFDRVILIAIVPGMLAVLLMLFGVSEKPRLSTSTPARFPFIIIGNAARPKLPREFWLYMLVVAAFTLSNSSDAFLVLKAARAQGGIGFVMLCLIALNISGALLAVPVGKLSDRIGRKQLIAAGWLVYAIAYAGFAVTSTKGSLVGLFFFYGAFYGFADGVERSFIADLVPTGAGRGFAYGVFSFVVGVMSFPASLLFGIALSHWGEKASFLADAAIAAVATIGLTLLVPEKKTETRLNQI